MMIYLRHVLNIRSYNKGLFVLLCIATLVAGVVSISHDAFAGPLALTMGETGAASGPSSSCSSGADYVNDGSNYGGIISSIVVQIQQVLSTISEKLFVTITGDKGFQQSAVAAITLSVVVYGVLFTTGILRITAHDFMIRIIKISIVGVLIQPGSWKFFAEYVVLLFNNGTDDIINVVTSIAVGDAHYTPGAPPFAVLDSALGKAVSGKMAVTLLATFATGPYGVLFGILLLMSLGSFLKSMLTAMWVYIMSLAMKTLLFGLAPIFLVCILFKRTSHLFDGWINQLVNASLQPILLFIFFAFFVKLIEVSIDGILSTPVCWTLFPEGWRGSPFDFYFWRFGVQNPSSKLFEPFEGNWSWEGSGTPGGPIFPINLMTILTFLLLSDLAGRFNEIVIQIAGQIASASSNLSQMPGMFSDAFGGGGAGGGNGGGIMSMLNKGGSAAKSANSKQGAARNAAAGTGRRK